MMSPLLGNAALMRLAMSGVDLAPLGQQLLARAAANAQDANALLDMSTLLQLTGNRALALDMQGQALAITTHYQLPARHGQAMHGGEDTESAAGAHPPPAPLRLLVFMTPGDLMSNTPLDCLLEDAPVSLDMIYLAADLPPPAELPEHDLLFIAIGPSAHNAALLAELAIVTENWPRPVINRPALILRTLRDQAGLHLRAAPPASGIVMPATRCVPRATLAQIGHGEQALADVLEDGCFPLIARPIDTHAGQGMMKIDRVDDIAAFLAGTAENDFHISRFIDYRSADGLYRKYRVVLIGGQPYACHMGISAHWMIHYLNAGMDASAAKRAEEALFMAEFATQFARRHAAALAAIHQCIPLDYLVIDCAEVLPSPQATAEDARLLVFEVDTSAVVHAMDDEALYPYKQPQMQKVFTAFRALLTAAARQGQHG